MAYWPLALELVFTLFCVAFVYNIYASWRKQPWYVTVSVIFGWWISFGVVFLVTVDLTGVSTRQSLIPLRLPSPSTSHPLILLFPNEIPI
jgi:glucan phosphoethanolaminetransferase (alkaline phosphatase superfamily)